MRQNLFFSLLTGLLLSFSFPPFRLGFLAYVALIPFFLLLEQSDYKTSIRWGFLTGLFINIGTLYWINWVTVPGAIAAILYLPVYFIIYAVLHTFVRKRLGTNQLYIWVPFLWTGIEYFRSLGVLGFPWNSLAYTQSYYLALIQYVSFTSVYGVSLWVVTINVIILMLIKNFSNYRKIVIYFIVLVMLFLIPWLYGKMIMPESEDAREEQIRVALIQGNIDPYLKWDDEFLQDNLKIYDKLTRQSAEFSPQLIIWPETAIPDYFRSSTLYLDGVKSVVSELNIPLITGAPDYRFFEDSEYKTFNAVFLVKPNRSDLQIYHKIHLVPFGERVPFTERFPLLKNFLEQFEMGEGNFSPGSKVVSFKVPIVRNDSLANNLSPKRDHILAPAVVCFESVFPELVRKFILNGSDILIVITNDAWFERSSAPYQHAQMAVFRAIENRVSIARCANTGVSMFIDPFGRTQSRTPIFEDRVLVDEIPLRWQTTFFTRHGNVFTIAVSLLNFGPLLAALFSSKKITKDIDSV